MIVYRTKDELIHHLDDLRRKQKSVGLVPTMGALHEGHISLVTRSFRENETTVVSIFVNPTQFNDFADLEMYPQTPEKDLEMLQANGVDVVFMPTVEEMYPEEDGRLFDLEGLDQVLEGATREGHFNGVAQIVSKLLQLTNPNRAYFGQKDFQQLVIIRHLVQILKMDLEIVSCPIIREKDGLAMSSRNGRLSRKQRKEAPFIYQTLLKAAEMRGEFPPHKLKAWIHTRFDQHPLMDLDYFEIIDNKTLRPVNSWNEKVNKVACIAVILGGIRLIDNMIFD
jgi:pantoate--beta-alanine ligase